jgi:hypothetical protein
VCLEWRPPAAINQRGNQNFSITDVAILPAADSTPTQFLTTRINFQDGMLNECVLHLQ